MFKLTAQRSPRGLTSSHLTHQHYDAYVNSTVDGIDIRFATSGKQNQSRFIIVIGPYNFEKLAKEMMQTHPEAAVKAFGAALQEVPKIPKVLVR
jgi:hypothetical protein